MKKVGADVVIRPVQAYPELLVRSMVAHDDARRVRLNMECSGLIWAEIICRFVTGDAGLPMALIGEEGIHVNPLPDKVCAGTGNDTQEVHEAKAINCLT